MKSARAIVVFSDDHANHCELVLLNDPDRPDMGDTERVEDWVFRKYPDAIGPTIVVFFETDVNLPKMISGFFRLLAAAKGEIV